jgi:hypothetical protein
MIRWCLCDKGQRLCCGPWIEYGGTTGVTEAQANKWAWDDFRMSGCPGVGPDGSDPPYVTAPTGSASVDPNLVVGPFDATGNDGINFSLGNGSVIWSTDWTALTPTSSGPDSAYVDLNASGSHDGIPSSLGVARYSDAGGGQFKLDADLSGTGVPYQVRVYNDGVFMASGPFQSSGLVGDVLAGGWPSGATVSAGDEEFSPSISLSWSSPISFRIRGDANAVPCDRVEIVAVNGNTTALTGVHMTLKNMDAIALTQLDNGYSPMPTVPAASTLGLLVTGISLGLSGVLLQRSASRRGTRG